jgi:hypothetical protein
LAEAVELALDDVLSFDMAPNQFGLLQRQKILMVVGFDLIERRNRSFGRVPSLSTTATAPILTSETICSTKSNTRSIIIRLNG